MAMSEELNCIQLGILADQEDMPPDKELVTFVNSIGELQFSLKVISDGPDYIPLDKPITCYANKFNDYDFTDNYYEDYPVRARAFEDFIRNKVILFRTVQQHRKGEIKYSAEPVMVLPKPPGINRNSRLIPMLYLHGKNDDDCAELLLKRQPVGPFRYYPWQMPVVDPIYVYVNGFLYGRFDSRVEGHKKWVFEYEHPLKRIACDLLEWENVITYQEVAFVDAYLYMQDFQRLLNAEGEEVSMPFPRTESGVAVDSGGLDDAAAGDASRSDSEGPLRSAFDAELEQNQQYCADEVDFINQLGQHCRLSGLLYDEDDLCNFHTALKVQSFVILTGMSGTGKSRLVRMYADALGLTGGNSGGGFKFIPVRPTWTDETDLVGFLDTSNNIYRPADTGLLNLLLEAEKYPGRLYLVCFDEMNLARVEHYFAQFLSVLEMPMEDRVLWLYNPELADRVYNAHQYPPQVKIGRNVLLVGTVNIDESTYTFSDKVLDRAGMLRLKILPFARLAELSEEAIKEHQPQSAMQICAERFGEWVKPGSPALSLNAGETEFLYKLHQQINGMDASKGIGYRSLRQIDAYLLNIPRNQYGPVLNRAIAFDCQLVQKVFPRLRGPQEQMAKLIGLYNETTGEVEDSILLKLMDDYSNISDFACSRAELIQKAKELRWFGYAS